MVSQTCKKMILISLSISALVLIVALFCYQQPQQRIDFSIGIAFGALFTILKVVVLERSLRKALNMSSAAAQNYTRLHYFIRYILTGVMLFVAAKISPVCLFGAIGGLLPMQIAGYLVNFFFKPDKEKNA